mmetsp:Transcript_6358/g.15708  ORF Transcript_6358/g.15708 Transcript_6358/m.15708 type:complete len:435 (-) Transcript_6358:495-1799(-)
MVRVCGLWLPCAADHHEFFQRLLRCRLAGLRSELCCEALRRLRFRLGRGSFRAPQSHGGLNVGDAGCHGGSGLNALLLLLRPSPGRRRHHPPRDLPRPPGILHWRGERWDHPIHHGKCARPDQVHSGVYLCGHIGRRLLLGQQLRILADAHPRRGRHDDVGLAAALSRVCHSRHTLALGPPDFARDARVLGVAGEAQAAAGAPAGPGAEGGSGWRNLDIQLGSCMLLLPRTCGWLDRGGPRLGLGQCGLEPGLMGSFVCPGVRPARCHRPWHRLGAAHCDQCGGFRNCNCERHERARPLSRIAPWDPLLDLGVGARVQLAPGLPRRSLRRCLRHPLGLRGAAGASDGNLPSLLCMHVSDRVSGTAVWNGMECLPRHLRRLCRSGLTGIAQGGTDCSSIVCLWDRHGQLCYIALGQARAGVQEVATPRVSESGEG